jgi:hypothetical protein
MLTKGEGSVHLTSSLRQVVFKTGKLFAVVIEGNGKRQKERGRERMKVRYIYRARERGTVRDEERERERDTVRGEER